MWTYLIILLSALVLMAVFVRRVILHVKGKKRGEKRVFEKIQKKSSDSGLKKKFSKDDRAKVAELCKKAESKIKVGKEDEAIKYFVQALAIDAAHIETQHKLAMLYMKKQMYSAACALFKNLGELTGEAVHYSHLGLALYNQKQFEEARDAYQKAVDIDPLRPQRFVSLAQVYKELGQLQNAVIALNKAVEIDKENMEFLLLLAELQREMGNPVEAEDIMERVREIDPKR